MPRWILLAILVACIAAPAAAQRPIELVTGRVAAFATFGFGSLNLGEFNDFLEERERLLQSYGFPLEWETIKTGFEVGGGVMWRFNDYLGIGVDGGYQWKNRDTRFSDITGKLIDVMKVEVIEVNGLVELWIPPAPHFHLGLQLGKAFGSFSDDVEFTDNAAPANSFAEVVEFTGSGLAAGVFVGYRKPYGLGAQFLARIGYRHRNLGEMESDGQPAVDLLDDPIEFDFGGFYARLGMGFNLF